MRLPARAKVTSYTSPVRGCCHVVHPSLCRCTRRCQKKLWDGLDGMTPPVPGFEVVFYECFICFLVRQFKQVRWPSVTSPGRRHSCEIHVYYTVYFEKLEDYSA